MSKPPLLAGSLANGITYSLDWGRLGLWLIIAASLLNGFIVSVFYEYAPVTASNDGLVRGTFLGDPNDRHADLIELDLSFPPFTRIDASNWAYPYNKYALQNSYHSFDLSRNPPVDITAWSAPVDKQSWQNWQDKYDSSEHEPDKIVSGLHVTPLMLLIGIATKYLILFWGPEATVLLHYSLSVLGLALLCAITLPDWSSRLVAFPALLLSYPFLLIFIRGNQGALVTGLALTFFIYLACTGNRSILAASLLVLACAIRPNAVFLAPLLFCFGWRRFVGSLVFFAFASIICLLLACKIDELLYPGYNLGVCTAFLRHYYVLYVLGQLGNAGNNSAFGAFKVVFLYFSHSHSEDHLRLFDRANKAFFLILAPLTVWGWILFYYDKLSRFQFAFVGVAVYALASAVFGAYHLFVFAIFPLLFCRERRLRKFGRLDQLILFSSVFMLIPKYYYTFHAIAPDVVLNPLVLLAVTLLILSCATGLGIPALSSSVRQPEASPVN